MPPRDEKVKKAEHRVRVLRTIKLIEQIEAILEVGSHVSGGGVVTSVSGSTFTVEFHGPVPDHINLPGQTTVVIQEYAPVDGSRFSSGGGIGGVGGGGGGFVGKAVTGGGIVVNSTPTTITIVFPRGVPKGPIELPGSETTIVEESSPTPEEIIPTSPFAGFDEFVDALTGIVMEGTEIGSEVEGLRTRFELPTPGSLHNSVRIQPPRVLEKPRNESQCGCHVFIASWDANGHRIEAQIIDIGPGQTGEDYHPPAGAVVTRLGCAANCPTTCTCSISVKSSLVS